MKKFAWFILCAVLGAGAFGLWRLHQRTERLRMHLAELRRNPANPVPAEDREELRRLTALVAQVRKGDAAAAEAVQTELAAARREAEDLAAAAQRAFVATAQADPAPENRDPARAFARLEYFQNVGRSAPADVVQTAVWAALKGEDATLRSCVLLSDDARRIAEAWLAELPEGARAKYSDPANLAVLALTDEVLKSAAVQIQDFTATGPDRGFVTFYRIESGQQPQKVPVAKEADGWRIAVPPQILAALRQRVKNAPAN